MSKEVQELIKDKELIGGNQTPKFLGAFNPQKLARTIEINKYDFMNDGFWIKYFFSLKKCVKCMIELLLI